MQFFIFCSQVFGTERYSIACVHPGVSLCVNFLGWETLHERCAGSRGYRYSGGTGDGGGAELWSKGVHPDEGRRNSINNINTRASSLWTKHRTDTPYCHACIGTRRRFRSATSGSRNGNPSPIPQPRATTQSSTVETSNACCDSCQNNDAQWVYYNSIRKLIMDLLQ